jgi:hypothetical protein
MPPSGGPDGLPAECVIYLHPAAVTLGPVCWSALGRIRARGGFLRLGTETAQGVHSM